MKKLLIVESPAKAKTIGKYLGAEFTVKASVGHIRDLPPKGGLAIGIVRRGEGDWTFAPKYEISADKKKVVSELRKAAAAADEIYLASDPDREGESIAWHLDEVLKKETAGKPVARVTYNEITKAAVTEAVAHPGKIDLRRVDAQQARRVIDRLVGYQVSPLLWKCVNCAHSRTLSAGRVQSVALRLLVERQREIDAFKPETYFLLGVEAKKRTGDVTPFAARLARLDGEKPDLRDRATAEALLAALRGAELEATDVRSQPKTRHALPPFTTSTLQQAASSVLGFSPGKTMKLAQALYEQGRITYMRTDSVNLSASARAAAKDFIVANLGADYYPAKPNFFKSKESAQEAHEAIRPTDVNLTPRAATDLEASAQKLYDLIWRRFVASQMAEAKTTVRTVFLTARKADLARTCVFTASATEVDFEGFLKVMKLSLKPKRADGEEDDETDEVAKLPAVTVGERLDAVRWLADEKQTKGPQHYSEASLIKALEENGVGRPSTYAATIETLKTREYAATEKRKLVPLERGKLVSDWLTANMEALFNVGYTAQMESELDKVESGAENGDRMLSAFYGRFQELLEATKPPAEDAAKFAPLLALFDTVTEWRAPEKSGNRVYDDRKFVTSVAEQVRERPERLSGRQLAALARLARTYARQIPDVEGKLTALGYAAQEPEGNVPDAALLAWAFARLEAAVDFAQDPFLASLKRQFERAGTLSVRQVAVLMRRLGTHSAGFADGEDVRAKIAPWWSGEADVRVSDPSVGGVLGLFDEVKTWKEPVKRGKRTYDDREFVQSVGEQFRARGSLTERQVSALKRLVFAYADQIADFETRAKALGLEKPVRRARGGTSKRPS